MNKRFTNDVLLPISVVLVVLVTAMVITTDPPDSMRQDTPAIQLTLPAGNSYSAAIALVEQFVKETKGRDLGGMLMIIQNDFKPTLFIVEETGDELEGMTSSRYSVNLETGTVVELDWNTGYKKIISTDPAPLIPEDTYTGGY